MTSWTGSSPVPRASQKITGRTGRHGRGVDDDVVGGGVVGGFALMVLMMVLIMWMDAEQGSRRASIEASWDRGEVIRFVHCPDMNVQVAAMCVFM